MSRAPYRNLRGARASGWTPPQGWEPHAGGLVYVPKDYRASDWELPVRVVKASDEVDAEYAKCAKPGGAIYFALNYVWTVDVDAPGGTPKPAKIPAYPFVRDFFTRNEVPHNTHVDKSRQMLTSWMWMVLLLWDILFHPAWPNLVMHRKQEEVDDGGINSTPNTLLGKVRYVWEHLPPFLAHRFDFKYMMVTNQDLGGYIKGETATAAAGRGPTNRRVLMDEAAYNEHGEEIFLGVRSSAKEGTILNSTAFGKNNVHGRIKFDSQSRFAKQTYHWSLHPERRIGLYCEGCGWKSQPWTLTGITEDDQFRAHIAGCLGRPMMRSPWYDRQRAGMTEEGAARDLDISYELSMRGRVWDTFNSALHTFEHQRILDPETGLELGERGDTEDADVYRTRYLQSILDPALIPFIMLDPGINDPAALLFGQIVNDDEPRVRFLDEYENHGYSWDHYHLVMHYWVEQYQAVGGLQEFLMGGDPAGEQRGSDLQSWWSNLRNASPAMPMISADHDTGSMSEWLDFIREQMRSGRVEVSTFCPGLIDAITQYHFPLDKHGNPIPGKHTPVHDKWSHKAAALRYLFMIRWADRLPAREAHEGNLSVIDILSIGDDAPIYSPRRF